MLSSLALLLALQASAPPPQGAPSLFRAEDYPIEALKRGDQGTVGYELAIGKNGVPKACHIEKTSGSERLDTATCRILMQRARFRPARDNYGDPVEDFYSGELSWRFKG